MRSPALREDEGDLDVLIGFGELASLSLLGFAER